VAHTCSPTTQEAEIRRVAIQSQPKQIDHKTISKSPIRKHWVCGVAQDESPEFKAQYHKKKEKQIMVQERTWNTPQCIPEL
jgi:hypothetical protein